MNVGSTERYRYRKSIGVCPMCGKEKPEDGKSLCKQCRAKCREEARLRREQAIDLGLCPKCQKVRLYVGEKICPDCLEKARKFRESHRDDINRKQVIYHAKRMAERDETKCIYCQRRPPEPGYKSCEYCRAKLRKKYSERRAGRLTPSERPRYGLCYFCGEPVVNGKKVCQKHYDMALEHLKRASTNGHYWRKDETKRYEDMKKGKIS